MLRQQLFKSIIESELSESELSEFIKTRTLPERIKKHMFDQDYVNRRGKIMAKRQARDVTKPFRNMERAKEKAKRKGFPDTRAMFAKEDIQGLFREMCGSDHGNPKKKKVKEQTDPNQANQVMMPRMIPGSPAERMAKKRMQAMRTARPVSREQYPMKTANRMATIASANSRQPVPARRVSGSPAELAAKKAAYMKKRSQWNAESVEKVDEALPAQVMQQRRPVPGADATRQGGPATIRRPVASPVPRPVNTSDRMKATPMRRPVPGYGTPRPAMRGGGPV